MAASSTSVTARGRHKITIESPTETKDTYGDAIPTWSTHAIRHAVVVPLSGREYFYAQQNNAERMTRFRVRYDEKTKAITPKMRVSYNGRTFDIQSVINENENNRHILIVCSETI